MPKAKAAAERAIALDPKLDSAHVALADVKAIYDYDWDGAQKEFARAIEVNPACSNAMFSHSLLYLTPRGRTKEAIEEMKRALELDPLNPVFGTYLGTIYYIDRQNDAAITQLRKVLIIAPEFHEAEGTLFHVYLDTGKFADARAELDRLNAAAGITSPDEADALLLAAEGRQDAARAVLAGLNHQSGPMMVTGASAYLRLGEKEQAMETLERAYERRDGMLAFSYVWPEMEGLRGEPRFRALLQKLHLLM
jgi:serine/threonine-protein kinase